MSSESQSPEQAGTGPRTVTYRQPAPASSRWLIGCLAFAVGGMAVMVLLGVVLVVGVSAMLFGGSGLAGEAGASSAIQERTLDGVEGAPKVAVIPVTGVLVPGGGGPFGADPRALFEAMLKKARRGLPACRPSYSPWTAAVEGSRPATSCIRSLRDFRAQTGKPVVVLMGDVAASGAYYLSCAADHVMAHPTTITGSIGVMMPLYSASDLLKKVGVTDQTITTGPYKDIGSMTAAKTPEEWAQDKKLLAGIMNQMYGRFVAVVAEGRGIPEDAVRTLADGRIFSSQEAKETR